MKKALIVSGIAAVALLAVLAGVIGLHRSNEAEHAHEHGSDDHVVIDPVADDPLVAAEATLSALLSFSPAKQQSPFDQYAAVKDQLTGPLLETAENPPSDEFAAKQFPAEWDAWAASGDRVQAFVTRAPGTAPIGEGEVTGVVTVDVRQVVLHTDGDQTPWRESVVDIEMKRVGGVWKAANFSIKK